MAKKIQLTQGKVSIVNDEDYRWLNQWKWYAHKIGGIYYAGRTVKENGNQFVVHMHRQIMGLVKGDKRDVDHINHNALNNRRINLRICAHWQNLNNQRRRITSRSRFKGVAWDKKRKKW